MAITLFVVGLFIVAIPVSYAQMAALSNLPEGVDPSALRDNLAEAGLSTGLYAAYRLGMEVGFAAVCLALAAGIFRLRSNESVALFVSLLLVLLGTTFWGALQAFEAVHPAWRAVVDILDALGIVSLFLFFYLFPDGRFVPRWTRWIAALALAHVAVMTLFPSSPFNPDNFPVPLFLASLLGVLLTGIYAQAYRYRRVSGPVERQQTKWVIFGFTAALGGFLGVIFFGEVLFSLAEPGTVGDLIGSSTITLFMLLIPLSIAGAILRYRLFDIDLVINRTLVYGALTASVVGIYVLVVGYLGSLFQTGSNLASSLIATGLVAVLFAPLRDRLQRGVNRLMYGERDEPYAAVSRLGERLGTTLEPDAVLPTIVETVRETLRLPYAAIALPRGSGFEVAATSGEESPAEPLVLPLQYGGETVGRLMLGPRAGEADFSPADRRLLDGLARHAGVAVHGVRVMADLRRSREGLVMAREEERRRLRRDLHDELAPTLAALGLTAATVGELIPADPRGATAANDKLRTAIRATVRDVRRLVYDLRPPALDELGLIDAIRERAARLEAAEGLRLTVEAPAGEDLPPLPAAVEVAAYRIVQEALTNVSRHARAENCSVWLACPDDRTLSVEVVDDGVGLPERPEGGVGLHSMRERAAELGGKCEIENSYPSGTRVFARLPLPTSVPENRARKPRLDA